MKHNLILKVIAKFIVPVILLFALYVQFHGDFGPGGGFQAGVIFSAGFILYTLVFALDSAERIIPGWLLRTFASLGVLIYTGTGFVTLFEGGRFLDYSVLATTPVAGQHLDQGDPGALRQCGQRAQHRGTIAVDTATALCALDHDHVSQSCASLSATRRRHP